MWCNLYITQHNTCILYIYRLLYVGVKIEHAKSMLEQSKNDPKLALQKINHKIMSNTMLGYLYWFQRFDVRICE